MTDVHKGHDAWHWGVPVLALLLGGIVLVTDSNVALFHVINDWSIWTGDRIWADLTVLGDGAFVFAVLLPFAPRRADIQFAGMLAAVPALLWVDVLKPLFNLPRPAAVLAHSALHVIGPELTTHSFPSGHSTAIFTLAGVLALHSRHSLWRWSVLSLAVLVGMSRCAVGAHWPLDVLGGAFGGWLSAWVGVSLERRWHLTGQRLFTRVALTGLSLIACLLLFGFYGGYTLAAVWARVLAVGLLVCFVVELRRLRSV